MGFGYDYSIFWQIGQGVLHGLNPYLMPQPNYPPAAVLLFAVFAILPETTSFIVWSVINLALYLHCLRRLKLWGWELAWLLFIPTVFNFISGQLDILYLWLALFLPGGGWKAVIAGALITTKPQIAFIALPWFLVQWLLHNHKTLLRWIGLALAINLLPLLYDPAIYAKWMVVLRGQVDWRIYLTPGVFTLSNFNVPWPIMAVLAAAIAIWGLFREREISWITQTLALPVGQWYDETLLTGLAPVWLAVPVSWLSFILSYLVNNAVPMAAIPVILLGWKIYVTKPHHRGTEDTEKT